MRPNTIPAALLADLADLAQQAAAHLCEPSRARHVLSCPDVADRIRALIPMMLAVAVDERPELAELERLAGRANVRVLRLAEAAVDAAIESAAAEGVRADLFPAPGRDQHQGRRAVLARLLCKSAYLSPAMLRATVGFIADELEARRPRRRAAV